MPEKPDCGNAKDRVDDLAEDALKEIGKMERKHLQKELKADLARVKRDLKAIVKDNHKAN